MLDLMEATFAPHWTSTEVTLTATSESDITFDAADLASLEKRLEPFGGPIKCIMIDSALSTGEDFFAFDAVIRCSEREESSVELTWWGITRVNVETARNTVRRTLALYGSGVIKGKRWRAADITESDMRAYGSAGTAPASAREPLFRARGPRLGTRRWLTRNRDGIIVSLGTGLEVSLAFQFL